MKVFQVLNGICWWNATPKHPTVADTEGKYATNIIFVEAPDYVFEHWGFDETKEGDNRFIKPTPPEGWGYDDETGQFYELEPEPEMVSGAKADMDAAIVDYEYDLTLKELGI